MSSCKMNVSLVICTHNRAQQLGQVLCSLAKLEVDFVYEVIVVDNACTDNTKEIVTSFIRESDIPIQLAFEGRLGLSAARNTGWRLAKGEVVAFTDDDCYPASDFLAQINMSFKENDIKFLGGRVLLFDPHDLPITIQPLNKRLDIIPRSYVPPGLIHGANFAFRRDVLCAIEGFDERLGAGSELHCGEDTDALARASALGYQGMYDPGVVVYHHHKRTTTADMKLLQAKYDVGRGALYAKGLVSRETRRLYIWPVFRRLAGNLSRRQFGTLRREIYGAWQYIKGL